MDVTAMQRQFFAEIAAEADVILRAGQQRGYPFYAMFQQHQMRQLERIAAEYPEDEFFEPHRRNILTARLYLFTPSALTMHAAVDPLNEDGQVPALPLPLWIEFEQSQGDIKGLLCYQRVMRNAPQIWSIYVVRHDLQYALVCGYDNAAGEAFLQADYPCPTNACRDELDEEDRMLLRTACTSCQRAALSWAHWLNTALRMIHREYAVTAEAPTFGQRTLAYTREDHLQRAHGKKRRSFTPAKLSYAVIHYEVSERPPRPELDDVSGGSTQPNWLTLYGQEALIYVRHVIEPTTRRYPRRRDGTRQEGEVEVEGHERYVPMLRHEVRPQSPQYRVVARRYRK